MKHLSRHPFYLLLVVFSIFSCFKKKATYPKNVEEWIEANFPGQLVVVNSNWNYDLKDMIITGKKIAVVADKADPSVEFTLNWSKGSDKHPELGLDSLDVQAKLGTCRADVKRARELFTILQNNGLKQFSVSSIEQSAYIIVFAEPTPAQRKHITTVVTSTLESRKEQPQTSIWIEIMKPSFYHQYFQDIISHAEWQRPGTVYGNNKIMSLNFEWKKGIPLSALLAGWELNEAAATNGNYAEDAYPKALAWAEKNLPKPFYLEPTQMIAYDLEKMPGANTEKNRLTICYSFPYFKTKPENVDTSGTGVEYGIDPEGYVSGIYDVDEKTFNKIKRTKEL
jgi:hypothetical protein